MSRRPSKGDQLRIVYKAISGLTPDPNNARTHSRAQVSEIAGVIQRFGFVNPVLVDEHGRIIAGHGRVQAAEQLKMTEAPCIVLAGLSEAQKTALALADNKLGENSGWDDNLLRQALERAGDERQGLGFSADEMKKLFAEPDDAMTVRRVDTRPVVDRFWITIRGPLAQQAKAIRALREACADLPAVEVELGTVADAE